MKFEVEQMNLIIFSILICVIYLVNAKGFDQYGQPKSEKLRVCFVEAHGTYKKADQYCPTLESNSNIECVVGLDRMDCLRRISKGTAHFGVFSAEDLVAAQWAGADILITNEMRFLSDPFEYEIVAVVANDAYINSVHDLRGSRLCHPGHGLKNHWTDILANYFESTMVARGCEDDLPLVESRLKASANFFGPSCKAGPWVADPLQDAVLKRKYSTLCKICWDPYTCGKRDKHWGRMGPLFCITSGEGDVAWVRLDDVRNYFALSSLNEARAKADPNLYSFLCPDGHLQPLHTPTPCVWVAQPWPAVAVKKQFSEKVQMLLQTINHNNPYSWESDYLEQAIGYTSAYSFPDCNPPRSIVYCTTSLIELNKCSWLQESLHVYGIEPSIQCVRKDCVNECMESVSYNDSHVMFVSQSDRIQAERMYHLKPLLYEYAKRLHNRYTVLAVVRSDSEIYNFKDFHNKRACFPNFEGAAYPSAMETILHTTHQTQRCTTDDVSDFFASDSCIWSPDSQANCNNKYRGDEGALRGLLENRCDVAFIDANVFKNYASRSLNSSWAQEVDLEKLKLICPYERSRRADDLCYMHWSSRGYLMINNRTEAIRRTEIFNLW